MEGGKSKIKKGVETRVPPIRQAKSAIDEATKLIIGR